MSSPSHTYAHKYAKFLVHYYPEDATRILCQRGSCDVIDLVTQQAEYNCKTFADTVGGISEHQVKSMILDSQWDVLNSHWRSPAISVPTPPLHHPHTLEVPPPTPSSTASGSPHTQRNPKYEWITVYGVETYSFRANPSGSENYLIGEDKLKRFRTIEVKWTSPSKSINLGGQMIDVSMNINLHWSRHGGTVMCENKFWVVRPDLIRHSDVLLGDRNQTPPYGHGKGLSGSIPLVYLLLLNGYI